MYITLYYFILLLKSIFCFCKFLFKLYFLYFNLLLYIHHTFYFDIKQRTLCEVKSLLATVKSVLKCFGLIVCARKPCKVRLKVDASVIDSERVGSMTSNVWPAKTMSDLGLRD